MKIIIQILEILSLFVSTFAFASQPIVIVSGNIINNTTVPLTNCGGIYPCYYAFTDVSGYPADINLNAYSGGKEGRFFFSLPADQTSIIDLMDYFGTSQSLCELQVSVIDANHATITQVKSSPTTIMCTYTGDPTNNTATVTLTENSGK